MTLQKKDKKQKGRMTFRDELASYFSTPWTLDEGNFYLHCIDSLPSENRKLIDLLVASRESEGR